MKQFTYLIIAIVFTSSIKAQTPQTDTSLNKTAVAVCDCLTKANISDKSTPEEMQKAFMNCIFTSAPDFITKIMSSGQDYQKAGEELGTQLAMQMMKNNCPAFTKLAAGMAMMGSDSSDADNSNLLNAPSTQVEVVQSSNGIVTKIEEKDFTYLTIKTTAGRVQTYIYYNYVPGSDDWIKDATVKLKNKNVSISYIESEVYQPKYKQFMKVKEIKTLTIK